MATPFHPEYWEGHHVRELTIGNILRKQAARRPAALCLYDLDGDRRYSYADVDALTNRIANSLLALGLVKGDHIAMLLDASPRCLFTYFAIGKIGGVAVPVNTGARGDLLRYFLTAADVVAVVAEPEATERVIAVVAGVPALRLLIVNGETPDGLTELPAVTLASLEGGSEEAPDIAVAFDDPAYIMYTSGTTGPSKGNLFVQATAFLWEQAAPRLCDIDENDIYYFCVSMGHAAGLFGISYLMVAVGGGIALTARFSASRFWDDIRRSRSTLAMLLGAMMNFVAIQPPTDMDRDHRLRILLGGPLPKNPQALQERFGVLLCQGYGLSDHSSFIKFKPGSNPGKLGSIGQVVEPFEVRIVDSDDFDVAPGEIGEIVVRSNHPWRSSSGYYKREAESMAARRNDWFHTGDRGYRDADGFYWFVDRAKDSIRRRGENISAFEVERVLLNHAAIAEAAAYPVPAETSEDEVAVSLVLREGAQFSESDLIAFCLEHMAPFMVPRFIYVTDALPKTITARVEKYKLREWAKTNLRKYWDSAASGS